MFLADALSNLSDASSQVSDPQFIINPDHLIPAAHIRLQEIPTRKTNFHSLLEDQYCPGDTPPSWLDIQEFGSLSISFPVTTGGHLYLMTLKTLLQHALSVYVIKCYMRNQLTFINACP